MKIKWEITIGAIVVLAILIFVSSYSINMNLAQGVSQSPIAKPSPSPSSLYGVDKLLEEMEFGAIVFNVPENINI